MIKSINKIKLSQVHLLCNTVASAEVRHVSTIRRRYLENALHFDETLSFLSSLKIININLEELALSKSFSIVPDSVVEFSNKFIPILFSTNKYVSEELRSFLSNFQMENDRIFFIASELQKIKFSDTRNLLLELGFISVGTDNATYYVNPVFTELFVQTFSTKRLSPESLKKKQRDNESIGILAEKAIIEYELNRLAALSISPIEIEHTSQINVLAGYDIKSYENYIDINSKKIDRFIEVKAVSIEDYKFYWSKIEIAIAKIFGDRYYL